MAKKKPDKPTQPRKRTTAKLVQATEGQPYEGPAVEPKAENDDHEPCGPDGLTIRRRAFVDALTGPALGNATKAAEIAGYASENRLSLGATAARLLGIVSVQRAIADALAARRLTPDWTRNQIADVASASMAAFMTVGPDGSPVLDWEKAAAAGAIGHIREWKEEVVTAGDGKVLTVLKRTFKLYDRMKALDLLAKMQGLVKPDAGETPDAPTMRLRPVRRADADLGRN